MALGIEEALLGYALYKMWKGWGTKGGSSATKVPWPREQTPLEKQADAKWKKMTPQQKAKATKATQQATPGAPGMGTDEEALLAAIKNK